MVHNIHFLPADQMLSLACHFVGLCWNFKRHTHTPRRQWVWAFRGVKACVNSRHWTKSEHPFLSWKDVFLFCFPIKLFLWSDLLHSHTFADTVLAQRSIPKFLPRHISGPTWCAAEHEGGRAGSMPMPPSVCERLWMWQSLQSASRTQSTLERCYKNIFFVCFYIL